MRVKVSSDDALVFLAGANLGAAGYEYGLAALTRAFLGRRAASAGESEPADDTAPSGA